ncbi:MAG: TolC family protein [Candidatus Omnitrophica bacterium]|nr:TolC family protein [Candidatus Omnitrophota bacterium]
MSSLSLSFMGSKENRGFLASGFARMMANRGSLASGFAKMMANRGSLAYAEEEINLTLNEAVAIGSRDNRDILLKEQDVEKAKFKIASAKSELYPTLDLTGGWNYTKGYYDKDLSETIGQVTLRQELFTGGRILNTIKYNGYNFEVAQAILDKAKLEVILDIVKAYYTLMLSEEYVNLNKGILENSRRHLEYIRERYKAGELSHTDILEAEASLASVEKAYDSSKMQLENTRVLLNNLLYLDKDVKISPEEKFAFEPRDVAFEEGFLKAMRSRPEIRQFEAQIKADERAVEVAKAGGRPEVYASFDYYSRSRAVQTTINTKNWNDYGVLGLTVSWPVFDGWLTRAKVEQAVVDLKESRLNRQKTVQDIGREVKSAYLSLKNAIEEIKSSGADLMFYKENSYTAEKKYGQGEISMLDNDDAVLKYRVSVFNRDQAVYDYIIAKFTFDKVTGGFNEI